MKASVCSFLVMALFVATPAFAQDNGSIVAETYYSVLKLRNVGPAFTSGRIAGIAIVPTNDSFWYERSLCG